MCYIGTPQETLIVDPLELPCAMPRHDEPEVEPMIVPVPVAEPVFA